MIGLAIVISVAVSVLSPYFLKTNNLPDQFASVGIASGGMTFVILIGGAAATVATRLTPSGRAPSPYATFPTGRRRRRIRAISVMR